MAAREHSERVLPIAGSRKCERCLPRDLDPVVEHFIVQLRRHLTPFKQREWSDEITQCELEIHAPAIGTDERANAAFDVMRAPPAKNFPERHDVLDPLRPQPIECEFSSDAAVRLSRQPVGDPLREACSFGKRQQRQQVVASLESEKSRETFLETECRHNCPHSNERTVFLFCSYGKRIVFRRRAALSSCRTDGGATRE
jgi:hypothetical protein